MSIESVFEDGNGYLSIPAMVTEVERLFSGVETTINEGRWNLGIESILALQCLNS